MNLPIPQYNKEYKQHRIMAEPGDKGIRASRSRWSWLGKSIKYLGNDNKYYYVNANSAKKYTNKFSGTLGLDTFSAIQEKIHTIQLVKPIYTSAMQGNRASQHKLGLMYEKGTEVRRDIELAIRYYTMSANQGDLNSQLALGVMHEEGTKVQQNMNIAVKYYKMAAAQNHVEAQFKLGCIYWHGAGVPQDPNLAIEYFKKAANQNHVEAQYSLGYIYENGQGVAEDLNKAVEYYNQAASQNHKKAIEALKRISERQKIKASTPVKPPSQASTSSTSGGNSITLPLGIFLLPILILAGAAYGYRSR